MRFLVIFISFILLFFWGAAQDVSTLQKKKSATTKEINYITRLLKDNRKNEKLSLNKLRLLNSKISRRNSLIATLNKEIAIYDECIDNNILSIEMLEEDLHNLRNEYAKMIRQAYKKQYDDDLILFLLSAKNFNQAYRRLLYLRRYAGFRRNQVEVIEAVQFVLEKSISTLAAQREIKQSLAGQTRAEGQQLSKEKGQQNVALRKLKTQKRNLQKKLDKQRSIKLQLEKKIQQIIAEEARKNKKSGSSGFALTPEQKLTGTKFEQNKKRLPWPVARGVIVERFGVHRHPVLSNVKVRNNGVDIATEVGATARAVFNGEVTRVFGISGGNTAVIIRHGNYLTVYSNLREVVVKAGDRVSTKQKIGTVFTDYDDDNKTILKFQIWHESRKMNPEDWIVR